MDQYGYDVEDRNRLWVTWKVTQPDFSIYVTRAVQGSKLDYSVGMISDGYYRRKPCVFEVVYIHEEDEEEYVN